MTYTADEKLEHARLGADLLERMTPYPELKDRYLDPASSGPDVVDCYRDLLVLEALCPPGKLPPSEVDPE